MTTDLTTVDTAALTAELERRAAIERAEREERERLARLARDKTLTEGLPTFLAMVPDHDRNGCSDEHPNNPNRCARCALLEAQRELEWGMGWPEELDVRVVVLHVIEFPRGGAIEDPDR